MRKYQIKKDGYVFLVEEHDAYGLANTYYNLGKDIDDPMWKEEVKEMSQEKPKKKKNEEEIKKDEF